MNQLNEKLRIIRVQIMAEESQAEPNMERLEIWLSCSIFR